MKNILTAILAAASLILANLHGGSAELSATNSKNAVVSAVDYISESSNEKRSVEITDPNTLDALWEIIELQQQCEQIKGTNYLSACPKLDIVYPDGRKLAVSYTWCSEEYGKDSYGMPVEIITGECFLIHGDRLTRRYSVKDRDTQNRFHSLISEYAASAPQVSEPENDILLICRQTNYAWGKVDCGYVIDRRGDMYGFDISAHSFSQSEFLSAMRELIITTEPKKRGVLSETRINEILLQADKINPAAGYSERQAACDMGQTTLYVLRADELIALRSVGDIERELNDAAAKEICEIFDGSNSAQKSNDILSGFLAGLQNIFAA